MKISVWFFCLLFTVLGWDLWSFLTLKICKYFDNRIFFKKAGHEVKNNLSVTDYDSENIRLHW